MNETPDTLSRLVSLVRDVGFPIVVAIYLLYVLTAGSEQIRAEHERIFTAIDNNCIGGRR